MMGWDADSSAADFYDQRHDLVQRGIDEMGYNLVLASATYPRTVTAGSVFALEQNWKNTSVGRLFRADRLAVSLTDGAGNTVWTGTDSGFDPRGITRDSPQHVTSSFTLPASVPPGTYDVRVSIVSPDTNVPAIALGIQGGDELRRYRIGSLTVTGGGAATSPVPFLRADFDSQSWSGSWLSPDGGAGFVTGPDAIAGAASLHASTTQSGGTDFLRTDRQMLLLRPQTTYAFSFSYRAGPSGPRSPPGPFDLRRCRCGCGNDIVGLGGGIDRDADSDDHDGQPQRLPVRVGAAGTGAVTIDDVQIVAPALPASSTPPGWETFEQGSLSASDYAAATPAASYTVSAAEVVNGTGSVRGATTASGYTEFLYSKPASVSLLPLNHYTVTFDYRALADGTLYSLARTPQGTNAADRGYTEWALAEGDAGTKSISFSTADFSDYFLVWASRTAGRSVSTTFASSTTT